jgi:putative ABC transport system ATP-binding protein
VAAREVHDTASSSAAAVCRALTVDYRTATGAVAALRAVDLTIQRDRLTVVAGPSGSGKSSLLRVLAGLLRPSAGCVMVGDEDIARLRAGPRRRLRRSTMGIVLQDPADNLVEYLRAREQVELSARLRRADPSEAPELLAAVGLTDRTTSFPHELSGGEQQRVAFAAAAVGRPLLLLADEPTAQLDAAAGQHLLEAVRQLVHRGSTAVLASHDPAAIEAADDVVWLLDGRVVDR